jgi:hypothetical protein
MCPCRPKNRVGAARRARARAGQLRRVAAAAYTSCHRRRGGPTMLAASFSLLATLGVLPSERPSISVVSPPPPPPRSIGAAYPSIDIHPGTEFDLFQFSGANGYLSHFWITAGLRYDKETLVRYYVDGEKVPSIAVRPLQAVGVFFPNGTSSGGEPWQTSLFGKTAADGGVWWSWKVPFQHSVRVTIERSTRMPASDRRYIIIRGIRDATQFAVGDSMLSMAQQPRLKLQRTNVTLQPYEFAPIFSSTGSGMLLLVHKRVISSNKRFTEGCIRVFDGNLTRPPAEYDWLLSTGV